MSYVKQTWVDKETPVDAEHLNHMEDGISENAEAIKKIQESSGSKLVMGESGDYTLVL